MQCHLSVLDNRLVAASSNVTDSYGGSFNVWLKNGSSNKRDRWIHVYSIEPSIKRSQYLGFSDGKCIFLPKSFNLAGGQYNFSPIFMYEDGSQNQST